MKNFLQSLIILIALTFATQAIGQVRYTSEIFDSYVLHEDVTYGVNVSALLSTFPDPTDPVQMGQWTAEMDFLNTLIIASITNPDTLLSYMNFFAPNSMLPDSTTWTMVKITPLEMDIYTPPASDDVTDRPVWINVHTGNFLPPLFNGAISGNKSDSVGVNICKQMAKRGYVAINVNYRLGWNPISTDPNVRRGTLLQAVFRALHDVQTAVRFMRSPAGAPFGINPDKIALIGQGSGGYVTQAYTTLSDYNTEIAGIAKFINTETGLPFVLESIDGTIDGGPGFVRLVDPLWQLGVPKDVSMSVNMGGSLADSSWLNQGEAAMVAFHCLRDPYAPFDYGMVVVPTTNENVVPVSGGNVFIRKANEFGNNDAFSSIPSFGDAYTDAARSMYGQTYEYIYASQPEVTVSADPEGLYPFILPINSDGPLGVFGNQGSPWDWWDFATLQAVVAATNAALGTEFDATTLNATGLLSNPGMGQEKGLTYLDTIQGYLQPRAVLQMELATGIGESIEVRDAMKIYPNPSVGYVVIENDKADMSEIVFMDGIGRVVFTTEVEGSQYTLNHRGWKTGIYFVTVMFEEGGQLTKKLIIK